MTDDLDETLDEIIGEVIADSVDNYPWAQSPDERRRCFLIEQLGSEYDLAGLAVFDEWLKTGKLPEKALKVVK